jgi:hypothetical protein
MSHKQISPLPRGRRKYVAVLSLWFTMVTTLTFVPLTATSARASDAVTLSVDTEVSYTYFGNDGTASNRDNALFRARLKAADQAADTFARRRLIQFADRDKEELVLLVADQLTGKVRENCRRSNGDQTACKIRLNAVIRLSDFIDAETASLQLRRQEVNANYREKMEPTVASPIKPGHLLAKAFNLIDCGERRQAIIYIDILIRRYPMWRELYEVKSMAMHTQNRPAVLTATSHEANGIE